MLGGSALKPLLALDPLPLSIHAKGRGFVLKLRPFADGSCNVLRYSLLKISFGSCSSSDTSLAATLIFT
jgi:hypothetical protein